MVELLAFSISAGGSAVSPKTSSFIILPSRPDPFMLDGSILFSSIIFRAEGAFSNS